MFSTILRHPLIGYALLALVSLAFDEYWRRWERVQRRRAELERRHMARLDAIAEQSLFHWEHVTVIPQGVSGIEHAIGRLGEAFESMSSTFRHAWPDDWSTPPLGGHAVMPDLSTARERSDGSIECDTLDSWSVDYGQKRESR